jgi:nitronate monooxygenase
MRTRLTEAFGIQHPIICAPMALVTGGRLAAAVSRAGGLGIVGGGYAGTLGGEADLKQRQPCVQLTLGNRRALHDC